MWPAILGGTEALHLVDPHWVVIEDLVVGSQTAAGIVIDDGGDATDASDVVIRRVQFVNVGCPDGGTYLSLSGTNRFHVLDNKFNLCSMTTGTSAIDMIGCAEGVVARNMAVGMGEWVGVEGTRVIQARGGSARITIARNRVAGAGDRAISLGGRTDPALFRPAGADYEARDIRAVANEIASMGTAVAFVGCDGCLAANNTIVRPLRWAVRILQESVDGYVPCRNGRFVDNLISFPSTELLGLVDVGAGTLPGTFTFSHDLWYAEDDPDYVPTLPVADSGMVVGDPRFVDRVDGDFHLGADSPALGAGIALPELDADLDGLCPTDPPNIGAY
jgi:hypothetical protein